MSEYGFDYFVSRRNVLVEMAAPSKLITGTVKSAMEKYKIQIGNIFKQGGTIKVEGARGEMNEVDVPGIIGSNIINRTNRYLLGVIAEISDLKKDYITGGGDEITQAAMIILGHKGKKRQELNFDSGEVLRKAMAKWVTENSETFLSPEFEHTLLNPDNILYYLHFNRIANTAYGKKKTSELEDKYSIPIEKIDDIKTKVFPYLVKINRKGGYLRQNNTRRIRMGLSPVEKKSSDTVELNNNYTENLDNVLDVLDIWINVKNIFVKIMGNEIVDVNDTESAKRILYFNQKYLKNQLSPEEVAAFALLRPGSRDETLLEDLFEEFEAVEDVGISCEDFKKEINSLKGITPIGIHPLLDRLVREIYNKTSETPNNKYPDYSPEILNQYLTSPESKKYFDDWYQYIHIPDLLESKEVIQTTKAGLNKTANERVKLNAVDATISNQQRAEKEKRINDIESKMESGDYEDEPHEESCVMNYMSEQVSKDRFNPYGEYKERGFKKPMNYAHWLMIND